MARKTPLADLPAQPDPRAPFTSATFLRAAKPVLAQLTADLLARADASEAMHAALTHHHKAEVDASRTADEFLIWRRRVVAQISTAWLLSIVFVRVLEDRGLVLPRIAGPGAHDSETAFFRMLPSLSEREHLHTIFVELTLLPAAKPLFDADHNLIWRLAPSAEACKALLHLFRTPHIETPAFRFGQPDTRFLGDLYQDLDDDVRERYALLQTPDFIESFILDRTLEPAISEYGIDHADMIDPTCGSGHFLLGAFNRYVTHLRRAKPSLGDRAIATEALSHVHGVDINPYAVSIARFRLTLQFLDICAYKTLRTATAPPLHVIVADSLYYGFAGGQGDLGERPEQTSLESASWYGKGFSLEEVNEAQRILVKKSYAAVVGNPPYITVRDPVLRESYRMKYAAASGLYALSAPFMERFFQLAKTDGGYTGQITSNSFTKREFGATLIEKVLTALDLELIINASGVFIPGHGTPTILVFGRNRPPSSDQVHAILAKHGEPSIPAEPKEGKVWSSICNHWNEQGFENEYISVETISRHSTRFHPWTLAGGGAKELKELLENLNNDKLISISESIGISAMTLADDVFIRPPHAWKRLSIEGLHLRPAVTGEAIRDWSLGTCETVLFPYDENLKLIPPEKLVHELRTIWPWQSNLYNNVLIGGTTKLEARMAWYEYGRFAPRKLQHKSKAIYAEISTHNHFLLPQDKLIFKQTATVINLSIKIKIDRSGLIAYLNSSSACFWMKQVAYPKGSHSESRPEKGDPELNRYAFSAKAIGNLPIPTNHNITTLNIYAAAIEHLQHQRDALAPHPLLTTALADQEDLAAATLRAEREDTALLARMVAIQEDLDWAVYQIFELAPPETAARWTPDLGLAPSQRPFNHPDPPPHLPPADRALYLARVAAISDSKQLRLIENPINKRRWWGARGVFAHKVATFPERVATAATERIADLAEDILRARCEHAIPTVLTARELERDLLLKTPHYQTLRDYLVTRDPRIDPLPDQLARESVPFLAGYRYTAAGLERHASWRHVWSLQRTADESEAKLPALQKALDDATAALREAAAALAEVRSKLGAANFALTTPTTAPTPRPRSSRKPALIPTVPATPTASDSPRSKPPELLAAEAREAAALTAQNEARQDLEWADTHHRKVRKLIPVPSKYEQSDFRDSNYFRLRGKLDVPRERFISYPNTASDLDAQPVYGWAGWNHLQRSLALLQLYYHRKLEERWPPDRLVPLLAGLEELLPWVRQWHAEECDPDTGEHYADALEHHIVTGCSELGVTRPQLLAWSPADGRARKPSLTNRPATTKPAAPKKPRRPPADPPTAANPNSLKPTRARARRSGTR